VPGPRLILNVRGYNAKGVANSDTATTMITTLFQERMCILTDSGMQLRRYCSLWGRDHCFEFQYGIGLMFWCRFERAKSRNCSTHYVLQVPDFFCYLLASASSEEEVESTIDCMINEASVIIYETILEGQMGLKLHITSILVPLSTSVQYGGPLEAQERSRRQRMLAYMT